MNRCIVGAADHHMAQALLELWQPGEPRGFSQAYDQDIDSWSMRARTTIIGMLTLIGMLALCQASPCITCTEKSPTESIKTVPAYSSAINMIR
jgi:hypothetical protein